MVVVVKTLELHMVSQEGRAAADVYMCGEHVFLETGIGGGLRSLSGFKLINY